MGFNCQQEQQVSLSNTTISALCSTQPPFQWVPGHVAEHWTPSIAKAKEWVELYLSPPYISLSVLEQLFFITPFFLHNIQPCYNVNGIILIINLLMQVLQDSQSRCGSISSAYSGTFKFLADKSTSQTYHCTMCCTVLIINCGSPVTSCCQPV